MGRIEPTETVWVDNGAGWSLEVRRFGEAPTPGRPPLLFVPGYAMNAHILGFHPSGRSIVEHLVRLGWEVWTANLRGQGGSVLRGPRHRFGLAELAVDDVGAVVRHVRAATATGAASVVPIGCSLGGSLVYAHLAIRPDSAGFAAVVGLGAPLRWVEAHPLIRLAFRSGTVAGLVPIRNTRRLAEAVLPLALRVPQVLSIYLNAAGTDLDRSEELLPTIDDPIPYVNRQLARWVRSRDLVVRGVDVASSLRGVRHVPALAIYANRDGIVPPRVAASLADALPGRTTLIEVGTARDWYAHADLFIGRRAEREVFDPLAAWLDSHAVDRPRGAR